MMRCKNINIKKRYIILVIAVAWIIVCIIGYINANRRFPKPAEDYYETGEMMEYRGMQIKAEEITYENAYDIRKKYPGIEGVSDKKGMKWIVVKLDVRNISDNKMIFNLDIVPYIQMTAYPIGYMNQGYAQSVGYASDLIFMPEEEKEVIVYFAVNSNGLRRFNEKEFINSDFYLDMSIYPEHKAFVFHGISQED